MSQIDNNKKYSYISVLSFKMFDRSCFSIILYVSAILFNLKISPSKRFKSQGVEVVMWLLAIGHHLSNNLRTTLTLPHPNTIDQCPFKGQIRRYFICSVKRLTDNWEPVNFRIFSCVLSHISTLAYRNSSKLSQYVTLVPILLSGEFKENRIIHF